MRLIRVTGSQLHAARVLVGLSREDLAERAGPVPTFSSVVQSLWLRIPIVREITEPTGEGQSTLFALP
jgi:hypothetical protein